ncbi:MAG TPA: response regulator [Nitrososphaeraceae archaeon]|jgi:CheY-like chemotaxis protein|nr:response regulator [Nitrososphaeraceae archaeon]HZL24221.1 response regulator [Nitrososphaeraceae archaeon]
MWHHSNKGNKSIKFTDDSLKCCVCFIEFQSLINNSSLTYDSSHIREYYSTVINSLAQIIKRNNGKIVKSLGDRLLCYFLNFSDINNEKAFEEVIQCGLEILEKREVLNKELLKDDLPPVESYKICLDYGVVDLALAGDNYQIDIFGSTVNICSKINSSPSLSLPNEIIIGNNFYRILKSFSNIVTNYNFSNNGEFKVTENIGYPTYNLKRRDNILTNDVTNCTHPIMEKQLNSSTKENVIKNKNKKRGFFLYKKNNNNKKIIIVDDNQEVLFTYRLFLEGYNYHITSFTDPFLALNYIKESTDFDNLLVILDIRMEHLNGFQLHQQIKSIDPTIKILFVTVLDILDELLTIIPGLTKEQIMRKPVDKKLFTNTVKNMLN